MTSYCMAKKVQMDLGKKYRNKWWWCGSSLIEESGSYLIVISVSCTQDELVNIDLPKPINNIPLKYRCLDGSVVACRWI